jgi:hypothetical protein
VNDQKLSPDEQSLFDLIPADGTTIGNGRLQEYLRWSDKHYWPIRDALVDKDLVARGRGRGGTLRRILPVPETEVVTVPVPVGPGTKPPDVEAVIRREEELYEPLASVLKSDWAKDRRKSLLAVEITARQGRRATGGTWSRPDLVSVEIKTYEYVPGKFLEIVTFEVKPAYAIDVAAVYEALAHRRAATHAYVLLHVPPEHAASLDENIQILRAVARSHGIGVILVGDPADYSTWDEQEEAVRMEPDPDHLNQFIDTQLPELTKSRIAKALR